MNSIVYLNDAIGEETIQKIIKLSEGIVELKLCRVAFESLGARFRLLSKLVYEIRWRGDILMKLTLSNMNLGNDGLVNDICETIAAKKSL